MMQCRAARQSDSSVTVQCYVLAKSYNSLQLQAVAGALTVQQVPVFHPRARSGKIPEQRSNPDRQSML